jgi:hypothetical protein
MSGAILFAACVEIPTGANDILSFEIDPLPSPSVVVGDSLRDTLGVVRGITLRAFNYSGTEVDNPGVTFTAVDRGVKVDSNTGVVTGDSVRSGARILATVRELTAITSITVSLKPDTVIGSNDRDSLLYALTDTASTSSALAVRVLSYSPALVDSSVASYLVSFAIVSPGDTALARLVNENGGRSSLDTTDASGVAGRRIRLNITRLTSLTDSVIVQAFVKYRGVNVRGSPARLVLKVKPRT